MAETLDRNHPWRVRLKIRSVYNVAEMKRAMRRVDAVRQDFVRRLRSVPRHLLHAKEGGLGWSALHHLRYMVFSEELCVDRWILDNNEPFSHDGRLPSWQKGKPGYGTGRTKPRADLEAAIAAWESVHARTQKIMETLTTRRLRAHTKIWSVTRNDVGKVLRMQMHHDLFHIHAALTVVFIVGDGLVA